MLSSDDTIDEWLFTPVYMFRVGSIQRRQFQGRILTSVRLAYGGLAWRPTYPGSKARIICLVSSATLMYSRKLTYTMQHMCFVPLQIAYSCSKHHTQPHNRGQRSLERRARSPLTPERLLSSIAPSVRRSMYRIVRVERGHSRLWDGRIRPLRYISRNGRRMKTTSGGVEHAGCDCDIARCSGAHSPS